MKIGEIILLSARGGWVLKRMTGSHRHYVHPGKPGLTARLGARASVAIPDPAAA